MLPDRKPEPLSMPANGQYTNIVLPVSIATGKIPKIKVV